MHYAISTTWGPTDITRGALPFIFAASALQAGDTVMIMLFHDAVTIALDGAHQKMVPFGQKVPKLCASFRHERLHAKRGNAMTTKTAKHQIDLANLPRLTAKQKAEVAALLELPDSEIDTSDIPPLTDAFWKNAVRNPLYKPTKTSTTVRVDSDVLVWLKSKGRGYQTRINEILRKAMLKEITKA